MRILFATWKLDNYVGGELFVRELAVALKGRGHEPIIHAPLGGRLSDEAAAAGVAVVKKLGELSAPPDVIHGQHAAAFILALRRFPRTPAVAVAHGTLPIFAPIALPRVLRQVAVDDRCAAWLADQHQIPKDRIRVILNFADLERFRPRPPLPPQPRRALVFSNYAGADTHLEPIRRACEILGLPVDVMGDAAGRFSVAPEDALGDYDLIFAKARCAIEALAVGASVVLCDAAGLGPMVTAANFEALRRMNFGVGLLTRPLDPEAIAKAARGYDAADATAVSERLRREGSLAAATEAWIALYEDVLAEARAAAPDIGVDAAILAEQARAWRAYFLGLKVAGIPLYGQALYGLMRKEWRRLGLSQG